ncbi:MFS transporter [Bacteroides ovatus]|jgi:hypothetical protein|uniref:MFS transporter n=1 Tax=Bacteroides ovatus TaxID=28116 RepID=UPI0020A6FA5E|nr:MFS transporter [Bacteroides ovatus]CAG9926598.1 hypothetical protein BOVAC16_4396 [Bacteroides ovatus]
MIYKNGKEITSIFKGERPIGAIYKGSKLVWQAIRSCFGKGFWNNEKPWNNEEGWKNN